MRENSELSFISFFCFLMLSGLMAASVQVSAQPLSRNDLEMERLWANINARLDEAQKESSYAYILETVNDYCKGDTACLYKSFDHLIYRLERSFRLPTAIFVCEALVKIAHMQKDVLAESRAYEQLSRFHGALGNRRLALEGIDKAVGLYEQAGDREAVTRTRLVRLEQEIGDKDWNTILPAMNALLAGAETNGETSSITFLHTRLVGHCLAAGRYGEMLTHITFLEKIPRSNPVKPNEYSIWITAVMGRADLARVQDRVSEAEKYYQQALRIAEEEPSRWLEIHILHALTELEWKLGNAVLSRYYLDKALIKAQDLQVKDLLARTFELMTMIAEGEGRYADALEASQKQAFYQKQFEEKSAGFNVSNYFLKLEKRQLESEKEKAVLQVQLQKARQHSYLTLIFLFALLAASAFWGMFNLRKQKQRLSKQNILIWQQSAQLKQLAASRSRFFANFSHELRTPLAIILGAMHSLQKGNQEGDQQTRLLKIADQAGRQLQMLIADILDLGKMDLGKMEIKEQPTDLKDFFYNHFSLFKSLAQLRKLDYAYVVNASSGSVILLDRAKFRQIANNLLSNAFKFTPSGGQVQAQLSLKEDMLYLSVSDTGTGIHPDDLPHVFDRFFQSNRGDQPFEGGTGIGLALCQEYVQLFGGAITVESLPEKGTTFLISFPVVHTSEPAQSLSEEDFADCQESLLPAAVPEGKNKQFAGDRPLILVVEDNPGLQEYLRMMPVMDGFQLLEMLKAVEATRYIPVIMLTARADEADKLKALRIGVADYLIKPFEEKELLVRIANLLLNRAQRQIEAAPIPLKREEEADFAQEQQWLADFQAYVRQRLGDPFLTVPLLAAAFSLSESSLLRQLKRLTGLTPGTYLQEMRLQEARRLLESGALPSVAAAAAQVGYADARSFSRLFKKHFWKLPSAYLKK